MKIDSHQHFWKYDPQRHTWITDELIVLKKDFLPDDLEPLLKSEGFDGCVAVQADQSEAETDFLLGLASESSFVKGVVGWIDLIDDKCEERIEYYKSNKKLKGIRHIVQDEPDDEFLLRSDFKRGVKLLEKHGLAYDVLVFTKQLPAMVKFLKDLDGQKFVIDHMAKPQISEGIVNNWESFMREVGEMPNVYCKVSGMVTEADWKNWKYDDFERYLDIVFESFGPDRIMVGSDWPVCLLAGNYSDVIKIAKDYIEKLSDDEKDLVMGKTAIEFYNL